MRALSLAREIVPARRAALLEVQQAATLYVSPDCDPAGRDALEAKLVSLHRLVEGGDAIGRSSETRPALSLPVMGLDEVIGVIRVEPGDEDAAYDARHLRLLSVIAAQLGAYLAMVRLRERDSARLREIEAAHGFQQLVAGVVGHDLRNPLAVITAVASSMLGSTSDEKQTRNLERALRNAEHASRLINDLVDVTESRVTGAIRVHLEDVDLRALVEQAVEDLRQAHGSRTIDLHVETASALRGQFDAMRISQIIYNLVNNALTHGEPSLPVAVHLYEDADETVISVRNWGAPIPESQLATIFDPFKQGASSRSRHTRGLGLGLYIVDQIVKGHGGRVTVSSDADTGTVFRVRLRRLVAIAHVPTTVAHRARVIMVVDDDDDVRLGLSELLAKRGYEVTTAANGRDALDQMRAGVRPHLILLDYSMPVMTGEELCEQLARDPALAPIPIVIVSADTAAAIKLARARGLEVLTKPVRVDQLLAAVESIH
ncbi:MAG TPA: ATP-binding protein [Kofleriaceae bacterium]|nr:ATP-binding protein [Kofleriaceae bacterium]